MDETDTLDIKGHIVKSVTEVFDTMLSMEVKQSDDVSTTGLDGIQVVGSVNFVGEVMGRVNIQVSDEFSRIMTASMLGMEVEEIEGEEEVKDMICEVANIVGGGLKSSYCDFGLNCELTTPSITTGDDFEIESLNMTNHERFAFSYQQHTILVEVGVKAGEGSQAASTGSDIADAVVTDGPPGAKEHSKSIDFGGIKSFDIKASIARSIIEVFNTMLSMEIEQTDEVPQSGLAGVQIVGSASLAGEVMGSINIQMSDAFARIITASMLGMEVEEIEGEEDINDVVGEVSNIIGGNLKSDFSNLGLSCEFSTPSVTTGGNFKIEYLNMAKYERFAFSYQQHTILVEVGMKIDENLQAAQSETHIADTVKDKIPETEVQPETIADAVEDKVSEIEDQRKAITDAVDMDVSERNIDLILDIPLEITVELGQTKKKINELLKLGPGSVVELSKLKGDPVDILVNQRLVARGEVVVEKENYGIRVIETISRMERIKSIG